ncbi:hypothetical protein GCM10027075_69550 [Streptomyces heilongjiangensis]
MRISSQELSQAAAGSSVLGALVVPTMMGACSSEASEENTPHPATMDMDATAARGGKYRFRLNTCMLLEMPYQEWPNDTAGPAGRHRPAGRTLDRLPVTAWSSPR